METLQSLDESPTETSGLMEATAIAFGLMNIKNTQDKFWQYKLWFQAIENMALCEERRPGMSPALKKVLQELVAEVKFGKIRSPKDLELESAKLSKTLEISKEDAIILKKWITVELTTLQKEFIESYKNLLKDSEEPAEVELLKRLKDSNNPIDIIVKRVKEQKDEDRKLQAEIEKLTRARDEKTAIYEKELIKAQQALCNFQKEVMGKRPDTLSKYTNLLKQRDDVLTKQMELAEIKQIMDENPPELTEEMEKSYSRLLQAIHKLEIEIKDLNELKTKYEAAGPEFKKLVAELVSVEEEIETKEWVLSQLNNNANASADETLNDSLFSP